MPGASALSQAHDGNGTEVIAQMGIVGDLGLKASARDNVTVVVADVVDSSDPTSSTAQIVGAAARSPVACLVSRVAVHVSSGSRPCQVVRHARLPCGSASTRNAGATLIMSDPQRGISAGAVFEGAAP